MVRRKMKRSAGVGTECCGHGATYGVGGSVRQSFMKLAAATATLTGLAMTAKMTARADEADGRSQPCRCSDRTGAICTSCTVDCAILAEV